uniref:Uncharacterized protein n=1 Tax=Anguilla anguilla TaxID=7936 RepID=A0A0E9V3B5_ANGAN
MTALRKRFIPSRGKRTGPISLECISRNSVQDSTSLLN